MKSIVALTLASAGLVISAAPANAADGLFIVHNGPEEYALRSSVPTATAAAAVTAKRDTAPVRKVRIVLPSPYAN